MTNVLVVNAGSTSLKLSVVDASDASRAVDSIDHAPPVGAVGHRVVHGGERFVEPTLVDDEVVAALAQLVELAALPDVPQVAVFDTAFHATLPEVARTYALPERFRERGIRRFGFHGLSVQWVAEQIPVARLVVCHLGGGSSVTAVAGGRSIDTTMGFTPLEGVPMATRAGSIDPGVLLYLLDHGVATGDLADALEHASGLTALAGTGDVAELERSAAPEARFALDLFCYRVAQAVAAMATALGGLDAVAFTGGVGQHSSRVRDAICDRLAFLQPFDVNVVPAREDVVIARAVRSRL